ncbi:MAG: beta-galactosidase [Ruminococcaceae bacterium]|nr:beta-galactosidase [Oscillospiraceae bacterium]
MCKIPRPEHPNPQWERKNWKNLNGTWAFEIDTAATGEERGLVEAETLSGTINVPFCPEAPLSGVGHKDFMDCVWYKKTLTFTEADLAGNRVLFHIGACDYRTKVWVNGQLAGEHTGGYTPIDLDITAFLTAGDNLVTVAAYDNIRSFKQPGGKQSARYASYRCYYTRTTGIWQTVWYEIVPESYIKYARITPDAENASVSIDAELVGCGDLSAEVYYEGRLVGTAAKKNRSVTGQLEVALSETHLWELGAGRLYDLVLKFGKDEVKSYFGLRSIELKDGKFYLNGKSVFQRLVLDQGYYPQGITTAPTEEDLIRDIQCGLDAGFNGARMHQKVFEPRYIYHADRLGYMVWGEYGSWSMDITELDAVAIFLPEWLESVRRDYNHPALITWCPFNETWDTTNHFPESQGKEQNNDVIRIVYEQTKLLDPTRPCVDTSGNYHVKTDIYDVHDYEQNPEVFKDNYDKLVTENELWDRHHFRWRFNGRTHGVRQTWKGEPVHVSEYGGIGFQLENNDYTSGRKTAWSYGKATGSYEEFYARYEGLTVAMLNNPRIFGFCYTQLTDVEQEKNGLFEYETRKPKFDMSIISEINKRKAAVEE